MCVLLQNAASHIDAHNQKTSLAVRADVCVQLG